MNEQIQAAEQVDRLQYDLLQYNLHSGYLHSWLVAGPVQTPVFDLGRYQGADFKAQIARAYRPTHPSDQLAPAEGRKFEVEGKDGGRQSVTWEVVRCGDDHYVNLTNFYPTCHYLCAWAYAQIVAPTATPVTITLSTNGPADLWLNGKHLHRQVYSAIQRPQGHRITTTLQEGENEFLICFEAVAERASPFLMALHIDAPQRETLLVQLPTTLLPVARRLKLEKLFDQAYLKQSVYHRNDELRIYWPDQMDLPDKSTEPLTVRLQTPAGRIYAEAQPDVHNGATVNFGAVYQVPDGFYQVVLMPSINEYYLGQLHIKRVIPLQICNGKYAERPFGTLEERRRETLVHAAQRNRNLYSEIARMALGLWQNVRQETIQHSIARINRRDDCSDFDMVGLLGMLLRYGDDPNFPHALRTPLVDCVLGFKYWMDEPGEDAMCYWTENHQILFHTCQVLAGQLLPDAQFSNTGQSGLWQRAMGEQRALSWLYKRAASGFQEWDSNCYFNEDVLALSHLAELAEDETLAELAAVVLDKLLFTMAINSFNGVFGSTHGRSYAPLLLSGRSERTTGISRLLWGQGALTDHFTGAVALACSQAYELPSLIEAIATDQPQQFWNRERHAGQREAWCDRDTDVWEVNKVTYKTPSYMLCSAQDYRPGEQGYQQHIWQATLGPDAVVFVNHPVCAQDDNALRPNFWSGNGVLPRVAQWKETLIALHRLPAADWMGWTHAYFPVTAFDEFQMRDGWAFARKGDGYLALTAANGLHLLEQGPWAYREIRSPGLHNIWLCQMGRQAEDGDFSTFTGAILANAPHFDDLAVQLQTPRGEKLAFAWEGPLLVNGNPEPITGFRHYDNAYCQAQLPAEEMIIQFQTQQMRLDFAMDEQNRVP